MMHQNLLRQRQLLSTRSRSSNNSNDVASTSSRSRKKTHEVARKSIKKRGVYVEIKRTETSLASQGRQNLHSAIRSNLPHRANVNSSLIASVLDVLSKSSTITCLAVPEEYPSKTTLTPKTRETIPRSLRKGVEDKRSVSQTPSKPTPNPKKERKSNHSVRNQEDSKPIIVLKPNTKSYTTQSSVSQERYTTNSPKAKRAEKTASKIKYKAISLDNQVENPGIDLQPQPSTLVSKIIDPKEPPVDTLLAELLETSFNVFNVITEYETPKPSDLKINDLNIEDKVANNLENDGANDEDIIFAEPDYVHQDQSNKKRVKPVAKERLSFMSAKSRSYYKSYLAKQQQKLLATERPKKHTLINILKRDLASDASLVYEEPTNFYEALKAMARNKQKNSKRFNFDETTTSSESSDDAGCVFKRRKLLSARRRNRRRVKKSNVKDEYVYKYCSQPISSHMSEIIEGGVESYHSLQIQDQ